MSTESQDDTLLRTQEDPIRKPKLRLFSPATLFFLLLIISIAYLVFEVPVIRINVGPKEGTFEKVAKIYQSELLHKNFRVEITNSDHTDKITEMVNNIPGFDVGFSALDIDATRLPNIVSLGEIQIQPLFIFSRISSYPQGIPWLLFRPGSRRRWRWRWPSVAMCRTI